MTEMRVPVWQFVRLMVQVEETLRLQGKKPRKGDPVQDLYDAWDDTWLELDQRLTVLGKDDPDAFSDLMMRQEVVLTGATEARRVTSVQELKKVISVMKGKLRREKDKDIIEDLEFEIDELEDLIYDIED